MTELVKQKGWRYQSKNCFFFISLGGDIYRFHIEFGPLSIAWENQSLCEWTRKAKRRARKNGSQGK